MKRVGRASLLAYLEELDADLPHRRIESVKLLGVRNDDGFGIVGRDAVGDDDDVERLHGVHVGFLRFTFSEVRFQDGVQLGAGRGSASGLDRLEDPLDFVRASDVAVAG